MSRGARARPAGPGLYRIHAVARATGVSEHALRVWERRYGAMASHRSESGYRLYTEDDVARVRAIKELLDAGHAIGEIATLSIRDLTRLRRSLAPERAPPALPEPVAEVARRRFLEAIERLDAEEASRVIAAAVVAFQPFELVTSVVAPLLEEVGDRWSDGRFTVAQEHAASAVLRGHLGELLRSARPSANAPVLVVTTPEGELHEFGAILAAVVAATAGARVLYLGPSLPAADLASAAVECGALAVVISVVAMDERGAHDALSRIRKALPKGVAVYAGGAAVRKTPPTGVTWLPRLDELRDLLEGRSPRKRET